MSIRRPTKQDSFKLLQPLGIKTVVDVGVEAKTQSLMDAFPDAEHILIEANPKWHRTYAETYNGIRYRSLHMIAGQKYRVDSIKMDGPVLIKVDVDGDEIDVLLGCGDLLSITSAIIVESIPSRMTWILEWLATCQFDLFDIVDLCYCGTKFHQCDLVFVKRELLSMVSEPWDITKYWEHR